MGGGRLTTLIILVTFSHGPASLKPTLVSRRCLCRNLQNNPELKQHVASGVVSSASGFPGFPSASQWHSTDAACRPFHAAHLAASYSRVIPSNTEASYERNEHWNNVCYSGKRRTVSSRLCLRGCQGLAHEAFFRSYYSIIEVGGMNFRVALDTASSDLWLASSACTTETCNAIPRYPLSYESPSFAAVNGNQTAFNASYADGTCTFCGWRLLEFGSASST